MSEVPTLVAAGIAGAITHEVAHWLVWLLAGRRPRLDLWGLSVKPRAGPTRTTLADRVAAAAPYVTAVPIVLVGLEHGSWPAVVFGICMFQLPSLSDLAAMRGRAEWVLEEGHHA